MASVCLIERGNCLLRLGRLDAAAAAYEEVIRLAEQQGDERDVAVGKGQLGTVYLDQRRYPEALAAYAEAREQFEGLQELASVAVVLAPNRHGLSERRQPGRGGSGLSASL